MLYRSEQGHTFQYGTGAGGLEFTKAGRPRWKPPKEQLDVMNPPLPNPIIADRGHQLGIEHSLMPRSWWMGDGLGWYMGHEPIES
ncbi:hypothetical protein JMJ77_0014022 [Colletotrichum scovillei]|uniref:Uncharacterized protein n=1 Tax=Colletotrichum scovillei TaxID=1209932 RepID=A0A9P7UAF6_9PEZI|nr:hypothetical protein JMJ77_0014022 [Colletotrichum scovillei]KAG7065551.1 hypothetical protein JMJ78_0012299 [Colletotrichum scovillei]KAG7068118.1 hypothetical protein JMJ76_0007811 [Colletotrichum scovillei]